ncbi:hypothetical protein [Butyrivibrio sp. MC2013]|nr:hypothetical protein [Butyrivibrio sp. MC2013]
MKKGQKSFNQNGIIVSVSIVHCIIGMARSDSTYIESQEKAI